MAEGDQEDSDPTPAPAPANANRTPSLYRWVTVGAFAFVVLAIFELNSGPALVALPPGHMRPPRPPLDLIVEPVPALASGEILAPPRAQQDLQDRLYRVADGYEFPQDEAESEAEWERISGQIHAAQEWCVAKLAHRFGDAQSARAMLTEAREGSSAALEAVLQTLEYSDNATTAPDRLRRGQCAAWLYAGLDLSGRYWVLNIDAVLMSPEPIIVGTSNFEADHERIVQIFQAEADCSREQDRWTPHERYSPSETAAIERELLGLTERPEQGYFWRIARVQCQPVAPYHLLH